ncbi:MAG: leucyl aminopeptidase, partial [Microbacterium sp.]
MPHPELSYTTASLTETDADALVLALPPLEESELLSDWPGLADSLRAVGFTG